MRVSPLAMTAALLITSIAQAAEHAVADLRVGPVNITLRGTSGRQQLLVSGTRDGRQSDLTRQAAFRSETPDVVAVTAEGVVSARGDGTGLVVATCGGQSARVTVRVAETHDAFVPTFERDVLPILTRTGCNAGACHGKARGQNGFQLSLLGFDADADHGAITREARGRRVFPTAPEESLLLKKGSAQVVHGGGRRLAPGSEAFEVIRQWIASGMRRTPAETPTVQRIAVEPSDRILGRGDAQQIIVTAHYTDGTSRDVTPLAAFQSNESAVVAVSTEGLIKAGPIPGEAAITARFNNMFATCEVTIPLPGDVSPGVYATLPRQNFIDEYVWTKLQRLGLTPSQPCDDATFLRRASLDVIGRLPTPDEVRAFLVDKSPEKRAKLVDRLLDRPEYADFWANKWLDLLRPNPYRVGIKAVLNLDAWVRDAFRRNMPYDEFVREIVTAQGSTYRHGIATVFRDRREPEEIATMVSQLFLGIRLECAKCHHHPFEVWAQDDFYGFAAFFARIGRKGTGLSPPISGSEEIMFTAKAGTVHHPLTNAVLPPKPLFGAAAASDDPDTDPREILAGWITAPENPYFGQVIANRVWTELMTRGIVEPIDDLRATNPATNPALLKALAEDFRAHGHDLKHLIRTIMGSYVYGLSSEPNDRKVPDARNYSRHYRQRLRAEVLLDAVADITGVPDTFDAAPPQTRATGLWTFRTPSLFLDTFGRPDPNQDPPCERTTDTSVVQALHLMNSPQLHEKVTSDKGRAAQLAASGKTPAEIVDELYLLVYGRMPVDEERAVGREIFARPKITRRESTEDLLWALINSPEFVFKD